MFKNPDITVLGTIVFDIFIPHIKKFPRSGQAIDVASFPIFTGGCGANTAMTLAKLGINVLLIGSVGNDLFGKYILDYLNENKIDTSLVYVSNKEPTSSSILFIDKKNERSYFHSIGASKDIRFPSKELKTIFDSKIFHIGGVNLLPSIDGEPLLKILKKFKLKNVITSIDLAWDTKNRWMKNLKNSLPYIDILMGNQDEIKALTKEKKLKNSLKKLHDQGVKIIVVKLGVKGSLVSKDFYLEEIPPFKVKSRDSTGAGDSFAGGFLYGILKGKSLYESALIGNYLGAIVTTEYGSTKALNKLSDTELKNIIEQKIYDLNNNS